MLVGKQGIVKDLMGLSFVLGAVGSLVTAYWRKMKSTKISGPRRSGRLGFKLRQDLITVHYRWTAVAALLAHALVSCNRVLEGRARTSSAGTLFTLHCTV